MNQLQKNVTLDLLDSIARGEVQVPSDIYFSMRYWREGDVRWYEKAFDVEVPPACNTVCCYWGTAYAIANPENPDTSGPDFDWKEQSDRHAAYGRLFIYRMFTKEQAFFWATRILENGVVDLCGLTLEGYNPEARNVSHVMFRNSMLFRWTLKHARFFNCDFTRATFSECDFSEHADESKCTQAIFTECNMDGCTFLAEKIGVSLLFCGCTGSVAISSEGKTFTAELRGSNHSITARNGEFYEDIWEAYGG